MKLEEISINDLNVGHEDNINKVYKYLKDDTIIGNAIITNDEDNKVNIYIEESYRGNGYGKVLFKEILSIINKDITVKTNNPIMKSIIAYYNGIELSTNKGVTTYRVPKINN